MNESGRRNQLVGIPDDLLLTSITTIINTLRTPKNSIPCSSTFRFQFRYPTTIHKIAYRHLPNPEVSPHSDSEMSKNV